MNWGTAPDFFAVTLLTCAFGSIAWRGRTLQPRLWLIAWVMIWVHFGACLFDTAPGAWGKLASTLSLDALAWGGILFMWSCVPQRRRPFSRWTLGALLCANTLYIGLMTTVPHAAWALRAAAVLIGCGPLIIALVELRSGYSHSLVWALVSLNGALALTLLTVQQRFPNEPNWAFDAVIFTIYLACCLHFWYFYRRSIARSLVAIVGFAAWAAVFAVAPLMHAYLPRMRVQREVWTLPVYVVALGMILLLLKEEIEHTVHPGFHDELTGLANRRLFQSRIGVALERAKRNGTSAALMLIDLDHFKEVNDTAGHHVGDLLLQRVSSIFLLCVDNSDTVARTGGDEFCILLGRPTCRAEAEQFRGVLNQSLRESLHVENCTVAVGASIGIAVYPDDADTPESLCIAADRSMYAEKLKSRIRSTDELRS